MIARFIPLALLLCLALLPARAQESIESLVSQAGADWMFGTWEATTDSGSTVTLIVSWELKKNCVLLHVKTDDMEIKGYTYKDPNASGEQTLKYMSFDDRGSVGNGSWGMEAEELVLRTETQSSERGPVKMAVVFTGSASKGLEVRMHGIDGSGNLVSPARTTIKFKKK